MSEPILPPSSSSTALAQMPTNDSMKFDLLSLFPFELREHVWKQAATEPKIVRWGRAKAPEIFHACHEAREVAKKENELVIQVAGDGREYGIYFNAARDMLHRQSPLPKLLEISKEYSNKAFLCPQWSRNVTRLSMPLENAVALAKKDRRTPSISTGLWTMLFVLFPQLEELVTLLWPKLRSQSSFAGLELASSCCESCVTGQQRQLIGALHNEATYQCSISGEMKFRLILGKVKIGDRISGCSCFVNALEFR